MGGAGAALGIFGSTISAYGDLIQGQSEASALDNQAYIANNNALISRQQGSYNAARNQLQSAQKIANVTTDYAASGVSTTTGSAASVIGASAANAELDRQNILHGADIRATAYQNQTAMDLYSAQSAIIGSHFKAIGALTGGAINMASEGVAANPSASTPDVPTGDVNNVGSYNTTGSLESGSFNYGD